MLFVLLVGGFLEFNRVLVIADKHVKMMRQNRGRLRERVIGREASVGPNFENQTVVIRAVADTRGFDGVTHAGDRGENGINGDNADSLTGFFVFVARAKTTANF